jgi:hypothetical protein
MRNIAITVAAAFIFAPLAANAATTVTTGTLTVVISPPPLALMLNPSTASEACAVPAGTVVSTLSTTGGDGNAVTYSLTGGDTTDFAVSGSNIVVGSSGIAAADCGKTETVAVSASQN